MSRNVYAVGVGPGSKDYITNIVKKIIEKSDIIVGYGYTLKTIGELISNKQVYEITMQNQEEIYQRISNESAGKDIVVPFTGDVNFSESEVVDRLIEIFGDVCIIPGVSSIQVAASRAKVPLDKSKIITMHVTTSIEEKKIDVQKALLDGYSVIIVPRPWPKDQKKHFMESEVALYLKKNGFDTSKLKAHVYEFLTNDNETVFEGTVKELEGKEFSDLSVMVINQAKPNSYANLK